MRVLISLSRLSWGGFAPAMAGDGLVFAAGIAIVITAVWAAFFKTW